MSSASSLARQLLARRREQRVHRRVGHEHRTLRLERRADLGIAVERDLDVLDRRILRRRGHGADRVARARQHDRAVRDLERARHADRAAAGRSPSPTARPSPRAECRRAGVCSPRLRARARARPPCRSARSRAARSWLLARSCVRTRPSSSGTRNGLLTQSSAPHGSAVAPSSSRRPRRGDDHAHVAPLLVAAHLMQQIACRARRRRRRAESTSGVVLRECWRTARRDRRPSTRNSHARATTTTAHPR